ncbi:MAG: zinc-dependent metalloprotease [Bacteroidales bacterium]
MIKRSIVLCASILIFCSLSAQNREGKKESTTSKDSISAYDKLFKEKHHSVEGMFTLHKVKEKLYFEIPLPLMGRDMLIASTVTETSDNANGIVGSKPTPLHISFTLSGGAVQLRRVNSDVITDNPNSNIAKAIEKSSVGSIMKNMKIETYNPDSSAVVVDVTSIFVADNKDLSPFDPYSQYTMFYGLKRTESFQQASSYLGEIKAFSDNIVVRSTLSYNYTLIQSKTNRTIVKDEPFTAVVTRSIVLLPEEPVAPRLHDYRVAIFGTGKYLFGEKEQSSTIQYFANRWNLVPKDIEGYREGKLSDPIEPITFYIDNNFPEEWREHVREGVEQWSELFEEIGFSNAVKAVDFPTNDPQFDPDNIKYSCVRYAPIGIQNAMGPSWVDPRSGQIINASVYLYHDMIKLLNNWLFVQISPANPRIRTKQIPNDIIFDGLRYVTAHEVGHCLGFMHNMSASSVIPVDSLRSPTFTHKYGTTTSIMDYARFNYVAQPGDYERGVKLTPPRFGEYDRFLIKWNYKYYPQFDTPKKEEEHLKKMVSRAIENPIYQYGKQLSYPLDPRSQTEDLGDDAIAATLYGIENLKYLISNMNSWVAADDPDFTYRSTIYDEIVYQYLRYINHIYANLGGVYLNEVLVADNMEPFQSVEKERQQGALLFIMDQINRLEWLEEPTLKHSLNLMGSAKDLLQRVLAEAIVAAPNKVHLSASISNDPYTFEQCANDVFDFVWNRVKGKKELSKIDKFIQGAFVKSVINNSNVTKIISGNGITINEILAQQDIEQRFAKQIATTSTIELPLTQDSSPIAGYGVPSTKFNILLNPETLYYHYLIKAKKVIESLERAAKNRSDKLHYRLLLKRINSTLKID